MQFYQYTTRFNDLRGGLDRLPAWGRFVIGVAAVPGVLLGLLSLLAFIVSILALLLLTVPAYRLVRGLAGMVQPREVISNVQVVDPDGSIWDGGTSGESKRVEARVVEG